MKKWLTKFSTLITAASAVFLLVFSLLFTSLASASTYGSSTFGKCQYNSSCPVTSASGSSRQSTPSSSSSSPSSNPLATQNNQSPSSPVPSVNDNDPAVSPNEKVPQGSSRGWIKIPIGIFIFLLASSLWLAITGRRKHSDNSVPPVINPPIYSPNSPTATNFSPAAAQPPTGASNSSTTYNSSEYRNI
jgi:hypothetical protein